MIKFLFTLFLIAITAIITSCTAKLTFSLEISSRPKLSLSIQSKLPRRRNRDLPQRHFGTDSNEGAIYGVIIDKPRRQREQNRGCSTPSEDESDNDSDSAPDGIPAEYLCSESPPPNPAQQQASTHDLYVAV